MYVLITSSPTAAEFSVCEPEDLSKFHTELRGVSIDAADAALRAEGAGVLEADEHAWIEIAFLRSSQTQVGDRNWITRFDEMVAYAAGHGWTSDEGTRIRAHLVFTGRQPSE